MFPKVLLSLNNVRPHIALHYSLLWICCVAVTRFNHKDGVYRLDQALDHVAVHFCMERYTCCFLYLTLSYCSICANISMCVIYSVLISAHPDSDDQREQAPFLAAAPP